MIEPRDYTYDDFPEALDVSHGMKVLDTNRDDWNLVYNKDVKYITRDGMELHLQILKPVYADQRTCKFPCIVYVQGSAWMKQDTYASLPNLAKLAQRGYVIAIVEYRHSAVAAFPAQLVDSKTAIRFMRKNASLYNVDSDNVFVFGDSSGGHTSLLVGITEGISELDSEDYNEYSANVNAVIDFYGPTDITKMNDFPSCMDHISPGSPEGMLIGGKNVIENADIAIKTNPITYLSKKNDIPPILIMHGSKDSLVPFNQSVLMYEALKAADKVVEFYQLKGAEHGGPQFWTDKILDIVEGFIKKNIT